MVESNNLKNYSFRVSKIYIRDHENKTDMYICPEIMLIVGLTYIYVSFVPRGLKFIFFGYA